MIHTDPRIIKPETYQLLIELQSNSRLNDYVLVGGTSLALQLGHRHSIDLDLFTQSNFNNLELEEELLSDYTFVRTSIRKNTLKGFINGVKLDFITHKYSWVEPVLEVNNLRLASCLDIAAMKLNAISGNGQRQKDFYDMYFLLGKYSLSELMLAYETKYPHSNAVIPLRALTYFDDIQFEVEPPELIVPLKFDKVKKRLIKAVENPDKIF